MTVKIVVPSRKGHEQVELSVEDAKREIQAGIDNGYIPVYEGKGIKSKRCKTVKPLLYSRPYKVDEQSTFFYEKR